MDVAEAARRFEMVRLRPVADDTDFAVLELRGGTHLVLPRASRQSRRATEASFNLMVDDIDMAHRRFAANRLKPSPINRGSVHDEFQLAGPDGYRVTVLSLHAGRRCVWKVLQSRAKGSGPPVNKAHGVAGSGF